MTEESVTALSTRSGTQYLLRPKDLFRAFFGDVPMASIEDFSVAAYATPGTPSGSRPFSFSPSPREKDAQQIDKPPQKPPTFQTLFNPYGSGDTVQYSQAK